MSFTSDGFDLATPVHRRRLGLTSRRYTLALILADSLSAWAGFILGLFLLNMVTRNAFNRLDHFDYNIRHAVWFPIGVVVAMALTSGYRISRRSPTQNAFSSFREYVMAASLGGFLAMTLSYVAHHYTQWEIQVLRSVVMARRPVRIAVLDDGGSFQRIATHLHLQRGITLYGRIALDESDIEGVIGHISEIERIAEEYNLDRVIFGSISIMTPEIANWYRRTTELVETALVPRMYEVISWRSRLTDMSGLPLLELAPRNVSRLDHFLKRLFDIVVALVLLIASLPITLIVAVLIKSTSRGPIFFHQERLGRNRQPFTILKFRTMHVAPRSEPEQPRDESTNTPLFVSRGKLQETSRRTKVGGFIRKIGVDEIPQFINVRPGITGLWQVSGRNNLTAEELRQLDYLYVSAWSMWWDIKICFDTPRAMLRGLGAY